MALLEARLKAMKGEIDIGFDPSKLQSELAMVRAEFDSIHNKTLDIGIDSGKLYEAFLQIRLQVDQLNKAFELKPRMNTEELKADLAEVRAMIVAVQKDFNIQFKMEGVDRVIGEMQGVNFQLDRLKTSMAEYVAISSLSGVGSGGRRWWLNWVHWIIAGGAELAAVVVPATVALGAATAVVAQGAQMAEQHMTALWTAAEATDKYLHTTMGQALGLRDALQQAQDAANPKVYQAMGGALDIVKTHVLDMAHTGLDVLNRFDEFVAHFQYSLGPGSMGGTVKGLLDKMIPDLVSLGQIFGNLGHALVNFAAAMPGLAEVLLGFLNAVSRLILVISELPKWMITSFMVMEEFWRWGGALATVMARLSNVIANLGTLGIPVFARFGMIFSSLLKFIPMTLAGIAVNLGATIQKFSLLGGSSVKAGEEIGNLGYKMVGVADFMGGPWGMAIAGAVLAVGGLVWWMSRAKDATQQWIDTTNKTVEASSSLHVMLTLQDAMLNTQVKLKDAVQQHSQAVERQTHYVNDGTRGFLAYQDQVSITGRHVAELTQEHQHLNTAMQNVMAGAGYLQGRFGTSFIGALALATNAGVKLQDGILGTGKAAQIAMFQIEDYVRGLQAMGQPMGAIGNDMSALAIQSGLAATKVSQLNQAWDEFMGNLTGGTNAFSGLVLAMQGMGITALKSTASMQGTVSSIDLTKKSASSSTTAVGGFANSLQGLGQKSAQTWQQFNSAVTGPGQQLLDWFRIAGAEGQASSADITYAVRAIINQMLPLAKHSQTATAELSGLAQQAGGPATNNFKTLKNWVDQGGHSMGGFQKIVDTTTQKMADMSKVATALGNVMQSMIINTMDRAQLQSSGLTTAVGKLTQYINQNGTAGIQQSGIYKQVMGILTQLTGSQDTARQILSTYTDKVNAGNDAAGTYHNTLKALNQMTQEYNDSVQKSNQPQKNLIQNLVSIGQQAHLGAGKIAEMIHKITGIPKSVILRIEERGIGHFVITQGNLPGGGYNRGIGGSKYGGTGPGVTGGGGPYRTGQKGFLIPGYGGGDRHLALLESGEAVVPKEVVPHVASTLKKHGVPGFQGGGIFAQTGSTGVDTGQSTVDYWKAFRGSMIKS